MRRSREGTWSPEVGGYDRLLRARSLIDRRPYGHLNVARLAAEAGFSRYHFIRAFRSAFCETPHQYVMWRRIERAKELLRGGATVTDACFAVGCRSLGSFSAAFSRTVGRSPNEYRAAMIAQSDARRQIPSCFLTMHGPDRSS